jgi:hypothetical protein
MPTDYNLPATSQQFLAQLDPWETQLFPELHMTVDCYEFLDLVNSQQKDDTDNTIMHLPTTVSNGSNDSGSMTFGWILALPDGCRLARCSRPAFGPFGSSFQAEVYRFLLVSQFLVCLQEFCFMTPTWSIRMITDNNGLLTQLENSLPYIKPFPNKYHAYL